MESRSKFVDQVEEIFSGGRHTFELKLDGVCNFPLDSQIWIYMVKEEHMFVVATHLIGDVKGVDKTIAKCLSRVPVKVNILDNVMKLGDVRIDIESENREDYLLELRINSVIVQTKSISCKKGINYVQLKYDINLSEGNSICVDVYKDEVMLCSDSKYVEFYYNSRTDVTYYTDEHIYHRDYKGSRDLNYFR